MRRLIPLRVIAQREPVSAVAWLCIPTRLAPIKAPRLGGLITPYFDWRGSA